ncbi:MAG: DUF1156 domain-containing protein [Candidatus Brocadiia bacterium]
MAYTIKSPRKLIEVALPLDAINKSAAKEKSIRHGHPSTLHLWWARRPLAAARAVIFAQLVNDPGYQQGGGFKYGKNKKEAAEERKRLFKIIEDLILWENTTNEEVLERARAEIRRSWREVCELNKDHPQATELFNPDRLPALHDPFAGGGAIPLEAQRLGLEAYASDLNPVAVLINKAMIEIPPKFAGNQPVNPETRNERSLVAREWKGAQGLAEDVCHYAKWIREEAEKRIGELYPRIEVTAEMATTRPDLRKYVGKKLTVIAWLWARTVKSPNPAYSKLHVPLASTFMLSTKDGKEVYVEPVIEGNNYRFAVKMGKPKNPESAKNGTKLAGANFICLLSGAPIAGDYIKAEGKAGRMGARLLAMVVEGDGRRLYLSPTEEMETLACHIKSTWEPEGNVPARLSGGTCVPYGLQKWSQIFTPRQLVSLTTFSDLVRESISRIKRDAITAGLPEGKALAAGGTGALAYAESVAVYLAFARDKSANWLTTISHWWGAENKIRPTFTRQALPMTWDYSEANPFAGAAGDVYVAAQGISDALLRLPSVSRGCSLQRDARDFAPATVGVISTDPPYYDNIYYADLSDFFYVWLRHTLKSIFPELFATIEVPKAEELVATRHRHGSKEKAAAFFLEGMTQAMSRLAEAAHPTFPVTIYYAFKQAESDDKEGTASTGWDTFLDAVIRAGFAITGTWPMRTENAGRMVGQDTNALASSIVLICRKRIADTPSTSRREFLRELNQVLPEALDEMTRGSGEDRSPVAPVDLSQAIIGPGMAIFSKYSAVLEADGSPMSVRTALQLINRFLAEDDFDADTQFCLHWFDQYGWKDGKFGDADTLARSKATSVAGVSEAGVVHSGGGKVRLLKFAEYPSDWDPSKDKRIPVWEALHQLIRALKQDGESGAGRLLAQIKAKAEPARQLAYRLYTLCERQGWAEDARAYNEIITSWAAIETAASTVPVEEQPTLFGESQ